jgi:hypothetical protein
MALCRVTFQSYAMAGRNSSQQSNDFFQCPDVTGQTRFHCWVDAQRLVNPAKIVVHEIQSRHPPELDIPAFRDNAISKE